MVYSSMGEIHAYQPLTKEDKITVILYRLGICISTLLIGLVAFFVLRNVMSDDGSMRVSGLVMNMILLTLYFSVGLSVFFIHLYVGKISRLLKKIYYAAVFCLAVLFLVGHGNPVIALFRTPPYAALLLIPLSLCLGFVTAKEAFCFKLFEGYILAVIMPAYVFFYGIGITTQRGITTGVLIVAALLLLFMLRKVFQPIHYDIGDKSAYQP